MIRTAVMLLAAALLVASTAAQSEVAAIDMLQMAAVAGGKCIGAPRLALGGFSGCTTPADKGAKCTATCSKNKYASFDSLPTPTATCTDKGWVVEGACKRVCLGAPAADLLDTNKGFWPAICANHTETNAACKAICYHGGSAKVMCSADGAWSTVVEGECKPHPRSLPKLPAAKAPATLLGALVDGAMQGGSPAVQNVQTVNYFDPGRVLVRPPEFMNVQVLNENGNTGIAIDAQLPEFGAFIGSKDYQLGQFADFDADKLRVHFAHSGARTCLEATIMAFRSPAFAAISKQPAVIANDFDARVSAKGQVSAKLTGDQLVVSVPAICLSQPVSAVAAVIKLL